MQSIAISNDSSYGSCKLNSCTKSGEKKSKSWEDFLVGLLAGSFGVYLCVLGLSYSEQTI